MYNLQQLIDIEKKYRLMEREIDGQTYWEIVRFQVLDDLIFRDIFSERLAKKKSTVDWKKCLIAMLKKDAIRMAKNKDIMFYQDPCIYDPEEKYYECDITSPIVQELRENSFLLSQIAGVYPERKLRYPETAVALWPLVKGKMQRVIYRIFRKEEKIKAPIKKEVDWLADLFEREQEAAIDKNKVVENIYQALCLKPFYNKYFTKVLKKVQPKVIIESSYYGLDKMFLNQVAKKLHIPTVELQHGLMGADHPAYNCLCRNVSTFPEYVFLFSELWKNETQLPYDEDHIRITGSVNLEMKLKRYIILEERKAILFVAQENPQLFEMALDLCKLLKKEGIDDKRVLFKLHPKIDDAYDYFCEKGKDYSDILQVVRMTDKNLYECFAESYIQIGESSTGLFEGIAFGLKTYIVDNPRVTTAMYALVENGYAHVITSVNEILQDKVGLNKNADFLWKGNALNNVIREIKVIAGLR